MSTLADFTSTLIFGAAPSATVNAALLTSVDPAPTTLLLNERMPADRVALADLPRAWFIVGPEHSHAGLVKAFDRLLKPTLDQYTAASAAEKLLYEQLPQYVGLTAVEKANRILQAIFFLDGCVATATSAQTKPLIDRRWAVGALLPLPVWLARAKGTITFTALPGAGSTITLGGSTWTFVAGAPAPGTRQSTLGATVEATLTALVAALAAAADPILVPTTVVANNTLRRLEITAKTPGTAGNAIVLAAAPSSNGTPSSGTLQGGGWHADLLRIIEANPAATVAVPPVRALNQADGHEIPSPAVKDSNRVETAAALRVSLRTMLEGPAAAFNPGTTGAALGAEARWNPYAVLFYFLELSIALERMQDEASRTAFIQPLLRAFFGSFTDVELALCNRTSAGHAILRRSWQLWAREYNSAVAGDPGMALRGRLRTILELTDDHLDRRAPVDTGAVVAGRINTGELEPPIADVLGIPALTNATVAPSKFPVMAFGRLVGFTFTEALDPRFRGVSVSGKVAPKQYLPPRLPDYPLDPSVVGFTVIQPLLRQKARTDQWARIATVFGVIEGNLDAGNAADGGVFSVGFFQWTAPGTEGQALFNRLKRLSDAYFDLIVRGLGYEVAREIAAMAQTKATGSLRLDATPLPGSFVSLGAVRWTFVSGVPAGPQTQLMPGDTPAIVAQRWVTDLNGPRRPASLAGFTFSVDAAALAAVPPVFALKIEFPSVGPAGNRFRLSAGVAPASNISAVTTTLVGGTDQPALSLASPIPATDFGIDPADLHKKHGFYRLSRGAEPERIRAKVPKPAGEPYFSTNSAVLPDADIVAKDAVAAAMDWRYDTASQKWIVGRRAILLQARWTVASWYGIETWHAQAEKACDRIVEMRQKITRETEAGWNKWPHLIAGVTGAPSLATGGVVDTKASILRIFAREALVASLLDVHINSPSNIIAMMQRAYARLLSTTAIAAGKTLADDDEQGRLAHLLLLLFTSERLKDLQNVSNDKPLSTTQHRILQRSGGLYGQFGKYDRVALKARGIDAAAQANLENALKSLLNSDIDGILIDVTKTESLFEWPT